MKKFFIPFEHSVKREYCLDVGLARPKHNEKCEILPGHVGHSLPTLALYSPSLSHSLLASLSLCLWHSQAIPEC